MLACEAITRLRETELKQLSGTSLSTSTVLEYLNEAILELHKRFNIWQAEATILHETAVTSYQLDGNDGNVTIDLSDKILLLITDIIDPNGVEININDEDDDFGAVTPKFDIVEFALTELQVGVAFPFSVLFRAAALDMTSDQDPIDLPPSLFEAMYFYVGFRAHVSQKGTKDTENANHFVRYIDACNRVEARGMIVSESLVPHKFAEQNYPWV